ncbi:MAG TPA: molybdopterin converting factor [Phycisphaerales bacterium]|nr:molybdopterin converting factor [Phycisphaerales bacterium]
MSATVRIIDGALGNPAPALPPAAQFGAAIVFDGVVRADEGGRTIRALAYEVYEPMASNMLTELGREMLAKHGLVAIMVEHSRGEVPVGQRSFRLTVHALHRAEALAAVGEFIDRMKRDVPIWKSALDEAPTAS